MMLDTSLSCAGLPAARPLGSRGAAAPPFTIRTLVIEGDSITSGMPSTYDDAFYSYRYADSRTDLAIEVRAQGSRSVGAAANLDDDSNTLSGNVAEDMAYGPDLVTALIGANDMTLNTAATYKTNLAAWYAAVKAARPECRVAWSAPFPYNPDESHANYANFTAQRAIVMADARDPAVWGQWADYYLPLGEHPDWVEIGSPLYGDGVHPTGFDAVNGQGGQNRIYDQFKAAVDTLADATRATSTAPYESVWPADETNLAADTGIVRRFVVSGVAHVGLASGISVSGGDAQVRLNGGAYGSSIGRIYNGDVIDLKLTTSSEHETAVAVSLTIGSETREIGYTTAADLEPVAYVHGDVVNVQPTGTVHTFADLTFEDGLAVLATSGVTANVSVVLTPSGGGESIAATRQFVDGGLEVWTAPLAADTYDVTVTKAAWSGQTTMSYGTVKNADPTPAQTVHSNPGYVDPPYLTPSVTVPANGLALAFLYEAGGESIVPATANSPTVLIDEGNGTFQSSTAGIAIASLAQTGQASFNFAFGSYPRGALVFAPSAG